MASIRALAIWSLLLWGGDVAAGKKSKRPYRRATLGRTPRFPYDPNTAKDCVNWLDNEGGTPCAYIPETYGISFDDFFHWVGPYWPPRQPCLPSVRTFD